MAEDLAQEGYIGLITAVDGYDADKGVKFSTYATHFIIGQIKHHLRDRGTEDLAGLTLMSDGVSVYECTSPDEVVDLLAGGQGVFGIALGRIWQEVDGTLAELPSEPADEPGGQRAGLDGTGGHDELARRRAKRTG